MKIGDRVEFLTKYQVNRSARIGSGIVVAIETDHKGEKIKCEISPGEFAYLRKSGPSERWMEDGSRTHE